MLIIVDGECAMPVDPSTNPTCEFQTSTVILEYPAW